MDVAQLGRRKMGRPRRMIGTTSIKIDDDANELVRKAATFLGVTVVDYASMILRERARKDLRDGATRFLQEDSASPRKPKGAV
jgi:hypothetical protein